MKASGCLRCVDVEHGIFTTVSKTQDLSLQVVMPMNIAGLGTFVTNKWRQMANQNRLPLLSTRDKDLQQKEKPAEQENIMIVKQAMGKRRGAPRRANTLQLATRNLSGDESSSVAIKRFWWTTP